MLWIKAMLGAAAVVLIQLLAQSRWYYLAALVPLFPTFALISHFILGTSQPPAAFKSALVFSMWALVPYLCYTLAVYFSIDKFGLLPALLIGVGVWAAAALLLVVIWQRLG